MANGLNGSYEEVALQQGSKEAGDRDELHPLAAEPVIDEGAAHSMAALHDAVIQQETVLSRIVRRAKPRRASMSSLPDGVVVEDLLGAEGENDTPQPASTKKKRKPTSTEGGSGDSVGDLLAGDTQQSVSSSHSTSKAGKVSLHVAGEATAANTYQVSPEKGQQQFKRPHSGKHTSGSGASPPTQPKPPQGHSAGNYPRQAIQLGASATSKPLPAAPQLGGAPSTQQEPQGDDN